MSQTQWTFLKYGVADQSSHMEMPSLNAASSLKTKLISDNEYKPYGFILRYVTLLQRNTLHSYHTIFLLDLCHLLISAEVSLADVRVRPHT